MNQKEGTPKGAKTPFGDKIFFYEEGELAQIPIVCKYKKFKANHLSKSAPINNC